MNFKKTHTGFKYLKHEVLDTLLPLSVIKNENLIDSLRKVEMPVFFHVKNEKFCTFLPDDFLKDLNLKEISSKKQEIFHEDGQSYFYFSYPSLKEMRSNTNEKTSFSSFKEEYDKHLLNITNGQLVIFIAFKNKPSNKISQDMLGYKFKDVADGCVVGTTSNFEFFKAYKFNDKYYLLSNDDNIDQDRCFDMKKDANANMNHLVIPYTDEDWAMAQNIYKKITDIKSKIDSIFTSQQQIGLLDKPFSEIGQQLLEDPSSNSKKNKP